MTATAFPTRACHRLTRGAAALVVLLAASSAPAEEAFVRVVTDEAALRSGPGVAHRVLYRLERGEAVQLLGREGSGYWLHVVLPDGRDGYVLGDTVEPLTATPDGGELSRRPGFFSPPLLQSARGGFALTGGIFDGAGYVELKPALVLSAAIAFEPYVGLALQEDGRRILYGAGLTLNLTPDLPVAPYLHLGAGGLREDPNEPFVREELDRLHARAGGGLLISLRFRISIRLEVTNTALFSEDSYDNVQTYVGGLGTYF